MRRKTQWSVNSPVKRGQTMTETYYKRIWISFHITSVGGFWGGCGWGRGRNNILEKNIFAKEGDMKYNQAEFKFCKGTEYGRRTY